MFKNLVTLVTGGASGLGCATVKRFAKNGSQVILCDIRESKGIEIAQQIGKNVQFIQADVSSPDDVKSLVNQIKETYGKLNAVVNCAGIANAYSIHNFNKDVPRNLKDFISVIQTNLFGMYNVIQQSAPLIERNEPDKNGMKGIFINTAGVEGMRGIQCQLSIAAASNGIIKMTKPLATEFQEKGIRVVTISPGLFKTPFLDTIPVDLQTILAEHCMLAPNYTADPDQFAYMAQVIVLNPHINATTIDMSCGFNAGTNIF